MIAYKNRLKETICERLRDTYPVSGPDIDINPTPLQSFGDLAMAFPFQLAKKLKQNPRRIAQDIAARILPLEGVEKAEVAGGGYVNLFLDRGLFFKNQLLTLGRTDLAPEDVKIIVEHTNINPNKAAHIGHLRNACLGDTLARALKYKGENVEVQNYIDDTGVQVVDVVFGFMEIEKQSIADLEKITDKFDYHCWDLYARVAAFLAENPDSQERKGEILKRIEHGLDPEAGMAGYISRRILRAHLATMARIGVTYDVLPCESSILRLKFWEKAFGLLKERQGIEYVEDGENSGCWIMRLEDEDGKEKVIVRSDGTVTYVGKDIAYQLWKFGLLNKDFYYEPFLEEGGRTIWITTASPKPAEHSFGKASRVYNVIDTRQSYLQKAVAQGLRSLKYPDQADKSIHFSYEMVALSPSSLKELDYEATAEEMGRSFLEVSGRKGLGVKADDLLDRLEEKALAEVEARNPDLSLEAKTAISRQIATGALRYFMLKYARNSLIIFDFDEALNFEGETGPYLQYTHVRIQSLFRKLQEREGVTEEDVRKMALGTPPSLESLDPAEAADFWSVVLYSAQFEEEILRSTNLLEFSHLAKFAFNLCQKFNLYYHRYPVLSEQDPALRSARLLTVFLTKEKLSQALHLMGIPVPERM